MDLLLQVKMIMATNRPDVLDPALLRPGRLDRKIEIPLPNEQARMEILKIHASGVTKHGDIDYEAIVKLADNFNGADLRNICTEAGMFAIRDERDYTVQVPTIQQLRKPDLGMWSLQSFCALSTAASTGAWTAVNSQCQALEDYRQYIVSDIAQPVAVCERRIGALTHQTYAGGLYEGGAEAERRQEAGGNLDL